MQQRKREANQRKSEHPRASVGGSAGNKQLPTLALRFLATAGGLLSDSDDATVILFLRHAYFEAVFYLNSSSCIIPYLT